MNRESTLAVLAVMVLVGAAVLVVVAPGALAEKSDTSVRDSRLNLHEPRVAAGDVGGETAALTLDVRMDHSGGPARNVTVEVQAIDTDTGLVATTVRKSLGNVTGDREVRTLITVSVARQGSYRLDTRVYEDGRRTESERTDVRGVESLTPDYADTPIEFHSFGGTSRDLPAISYSIAGSENNRTTLETQTYLTNRGDESAGGLELVVVARQVESGVVADRATVQIGDVGPGQTATPTATLDVPSSYNYYLDGILRKDGVIVGSASAGAMLDPSRPVPENETREAVEFSAGDFESETPTPREERDEQTPRPTVESGPGFGIAAALLALVVLAIARVRRKS